jgi:hypothetical protein
MEMMDKMMESMMAGMSKEEKEEMMGKMMEKFFAGMTADDKQKMMEQMMSSCGPEMKKWMEACTSNMSEACFSCCGTQTKTETTEKK